MNFKNIFGTALVGGLALAGTASASNNDIAELKAMLIKQQEQINEMKTVNADAMKQYMSLSKGDGEKLSLAKYTKNFKIKGDLRYRYQEDEKHSGGDKGTRQRSRVRFRIGMIWQTNEDWEIGARLVTGNPEDARSTNHTYGGTGSAFEASPTSFDLTYAKRKWDLENNAKATLTIGQQIAPWRKKIDSMFTNGDINPAGVTLAYTKDKYFTHAGAYTVSQLNSGRGSEGTEDILMFVAEGGYESKTTQAVLGFWHFNDQIREASAGGKLGAGGTDDAGASITDEDFGFDILRARLAHTFKTDAADIKLHGDVAYNFGASGDGQYEDDPSVSGDNPFAYVVGASVKVNDFTFGYKYNHVEANALPWFMVEPNFNGGTTNGKGHMLSVKYKINKSMNFRFRTFISNSIEDNNVDSTDTTVYQADLNYKF